MFHSESILYITVELELKFISSTGCTIFLSRDYKLPVRLEGLSRKVSVFKGFSFYPDALET